MGFSGLNWVAIACMPIALNKQLPILYFFGWLSYATSRSQNANSVWRLFRSNKGGQDKTRILKPLLCYTNFRPPKRRRAATRLRGLKNKGGKKPGFDLISSSIFQYFFTKCCWKKRLGTVGAKSSWYFY